MKAEKKTKVVEEIVEVEKSDGITLHLSDEDAKMLFTFLDGEGDGFANARIAVSESSYSHDIYDLQSVLSDAGVSKDQTLLDLMEQ